MDNPEIKLEIKTIDKVLEFVGYIALAALWVFVVWEYQNLPDTIPVHFDMLGKPDDFGDKQAVFTMPVIATFIFFILTVAIQNPQYFNFPVEITPENAKRQYTFAVRILRVLKGGIPLLFLTIEFFSWNETPDSWIIAMFFAVLFLLVGWLLTKAFRS